MPHIMFAYRDNDLFWYAHDSRHFAELHGVPSSSIVAVKVTIADDGRYFGWLDSKNDRVRLIWPSEAQRDMCFPYGPEVAEEKGEGRRIRVNIEPFDKRSRLLDAVIRKTLPDATAAVKKLYADVWKECQARRNSNIDEALRAAGFNGFLVDSEIFQMSASPESTSENIAERELARIAEAEKEPARP